MQAANQHAGNGNDHASEMSHAFNQIQNMNPNDTNVDEDAVQRQHAQAYQQGNAGNMDAGSMGGSVLRTPLAFQHDKDWDI